MKAIVCTKYGPPEVLQLQEVAKPTLKVNETLIRVRATSVNFEDLIARNFTSVSPREFHMPFLFWLLAKITLGINQPKITILGSEFAGQVEAVGKNAKRFKPGDQVFGFPGQSFGAYAEYLRMPEDGTLAIKPNNMTYEEAAVLPYGAIIALHLLRKANLQQNRLLMLTVTSKKVIKREM